MDTGDELGGGSAIGHEVEAVRSITKMAKTANIWYVAVLVFASSSLLVATTSTDAEQKGSAVV